MSAADTSSHQVNLLTNADSLHQGPKDIDWIRRIGFGVLALQLIGLLFWSNFQAQRFALTMDFATYHQAWWLIGHGHFDPFSSIMNMPFWTNHGEFLIWPIALLGFIWPHSVTLLWIQDFAVVGAEAVAFTWICDFAGSLSKGRMNPRMPMLLKATGLILLVANPWTYWALSFDFHFEPIGLLFVVLVARDLHRDPTRRRIWLWVGLALACGDVIATYVAAVGLSSMLAGRPWRRAGLTVTGVAVLWSILLPIIGANRGSGLISSYGYLAAGAGAPVAAQLGLTQVATGIVGHPARLLSVLWSHRLDLYAKIGPGGLVGVFFPLIVVPVVLLLLENGLNASGHFLAPGYQDILLCVFLPIGTVAVLAKFSRHYFRSAVTGTVIVALNALIWGAVWIPKTEPNWITVSPSAAQVLLSIKQQIPATDEVLASQGVVGEFSDRQWIYSLPGLGLVRVHSSPVWIVIAPSQGIEVDSVTQSEALITELAGPLHAKLVVYGAGIWLFRWIPPPGTRTLNIFPSVATIGAWTAPGDAGHPITQGPSTNWRAVGTGRPGYVISGDYWAEMRGHYQATIVLSSTAAVGVEVWNSTGDVLLAREDLVPTKGTIEVRVPYNVSHLYPKFVYSGAGPFSIVPLAPSSGNQMEIRVWSPGGGQVNVYSLSVAAVKG